MKTRLILFVLPLLIFACKPGKEKDLSKIIIAGQLLYTSDANIVLSTQDEELINAKTDSLGNFHMSLKAPHAVYYYLDTDLGEINLFVKAGDSIYLKFDGEKVDFQADRSRENQLLTEKTQLKATLGMDDLFSMMQLQKEDFFSLMDKYNDEANRWKLNFEKGEKNVDSLFIKLEKESLQFEILRNKKTYPMYHAYLNRLENLEDINFPSEKIERQIEAIDQSDKDLLLIPDYALLIQSRIEELAQKSIAESKDKEANYTNYVLAAYALTDSVYQTKHLREYLKFKLLYDYIRIDGAEKADSIYTIFAAANSDDYLMKKIELEIAKWENLRKGKPIPEMEFENQFGNYVKLSDLKGKLVYIDVWATWCGPCIAEHLYWNELQKEYANENIAFLSISIDDERDTWLNMVQRKKMEGMQWYAEGAWYSLLARHFQIFGIPRFILIDEEGKIIDANAERPSGKIREILDHLKQKEV